MLFLLALLSFSFNVSVTALPMYEPHPGAMNFHAGYVALQAITTPSPNEFGCWTPVLPTVSER